LQIVHHDAEVVVPAVTVVLAAVFFPKMHLLVQQHLLWNGTCDFRPSHLSLLETCIHLQNVNVFLVLFDSDPLAKYQFQYLRLVSS
jgi:hypothetical protein